jgi:hypothetical protein
VPHIPQPEVIPGIAGPMIFSPGTAKPMNEPAELLLRGPNALSPAERKRIATYVSSRNDCSFCPTVDRASGTEGYPNSIPSPLLSQEQNA